MAIPDHVKRQAMDAVSHRETTDFMRLYGFSSEPVLASAARHRSEPVPPAPVTDDVKRRALDAVSHRETNAHIRLVENTGETVAPATPSRASAYAAERVSELHRAGIGLEAVQRHVTQDGFGRLYG